MSKLSLGIIETVGLAAAIEAADTCVKSANVKLVGYELSKGSGMTVVKIVGDVGAVKAAISAAEMAASWVSAVVSCKVIARPSEQLGMMIENGETVGLEMPPCEEETAEKAEEAEVIQETETVEIVQKTEEAEVIEETKIVEEVEKIEETELTEETEEAEVIEDIETVEKVEETETIEEVESRVLESVSEEKKDEITCNICNDPLCPRKKGDLRRECIHYKRRQGGKK